MSVPQLNPFTVGTTADRAFRIAVVCAANQCRSPMAESVIRAMAAADGQRAIEVESAGVRVVREGVRPDARAQAALRSRGYALAPTRSRQLVAADFERLDLLLAMDRENLSDMRAMSPALHKVRLLLDFAPGCDAREVPDPYFSSVLGFERVLDLCEAGARGLLAALRGPASQLVQPIATSSE